MARGIGLRTEISKIGQMLFVVEQQEGTCQFQRFHRDLMRQIVVGLPDDTAALAPGVFNEVPADNVTRLIGIAARDQSRNIPHPLAGSMEYTAGMTHPRPAQIRLPGGKEIACLAACRISVKQQSVRADIVFLLQLGQCTQQGASRPGTRFPIVIVLQAGNYKEDIVLIAPFSPAHPTGGIRFAVRIASSEDDQHPVSRSAFRIVAVRHPILEHCLLVLWRTSLDLDRVGSKS